MARPHPMQPDPGPDGFWSSCDDEQPGVSIRPLSQADLAALLAHLDHDEGQEQKDFLGFGGPAPVVVRVRASVGQPGASAHAEYRRRRATELATWVRSLPWRIVALVAAGVATWLAAAPVAPNLAAPTGVTVAAGVGWLLRFRSTPDTAAWRRGAAGSGAPPAAWLRWSGAAGRSCTTWPSSGRPPTSTAMIPTAAVVARSDPNIDRPGAFRVDLSTGAVAAAWHRPVGRM